MQFPAILEQKTGFRGFFWKAARIGTPHSLGAQISYSKTTIPLHMLGFIGARIRVIWFQSLNNTLVMFLYKHMHDGNISSVESFQTSSYGRTFS
ncbi:hypothetical protein YC2023_123349 [Brassica napus]